MADKTIGELPSLSTMEDDTLIPVEHDGEAKSMAGTVLQGYVYDLVQDDVETISEIIAVGPKGEDGVSPTLSSSKTGKVTTVYYTDATHTSPTVLATLQDGLDGTGAGDMVKSVYDTDDDGVVDDSERLGGELPSHYATLDSNGKVAPDQISSRIVPIYNSTTLNSTHAECILEAIVSVTITIPTGLPVGTKIEVLNYTTSGTITITPANGVSLNGDTISKTIGTPFQSAVLRCMHSDIWIIQSFI